MFLSVHSFKNDSVLYMDTMLRTILPSYMGNYIRRRCTGTAESMLAFVFYEQMRLYSEIST